MGSKGSNTTTTNQVSTYQPNPQAAGYITNALDRANQTANLPFAIPQAPVAGFSQDQLAAFQGVRNAQGMAQPYINTAANYFSPEGAQAFYNPMAANVTANLKDIFGQQQAQTTGQLTQAAGGVGADRIAVGQSELAKQQGLAAGQTYANLYGQAVQQAQGAGYGTAALGSQAQNAALQGAQAQLGTGGLQQQLQQAQLNAPYQLELAKAAFPYQQSQFLSGTVGALAPGLGGTTSGQGTTTLPAPSPLSQILGLGVAGAGLAGGFGAFNPTSGANPFGSSPAYGGGNMYSGDAYGGNSANPLPGLMPSDYGSGFAQGGTANPYYDEGGAVSDEPIDVAAHPFIPNEQLHAIQPHIPQLNLNPPSQQQQSGGGGADIGKMIQTGVQLASMFAKRGGRINPRKFDGYNPYAFAAGGGTSFADRWDALSGPAQDDVVNPDQPYRMPDQEAVDNWRRERDSDMAFAQPDRNPGALPRVVATGRPPAAPPPDRAEDVNPYSPPAARAVEAVSEPEPKDRGFAASPWAALMQAGLGMAAGTSPFALTNIAQGGLQGLKTLDNQRTAAQKDTTIEQAAKRLEQEAKFHEDQYSRMTPYQKAQMDVHERAAKFQEMQPVKVGTDLLGRDVYAKKDPTTGDYINIMTGKKVEDSTLQIPPTYNIPAPQSENDPAALPPHARLTQGVNAPEGVRPEILAQLPPQRAATIKAIDEGRQSLTSVPLRERQSVIDQLNAYDPAFDQTTWTARNQQQRDLSTNGNAGKMILAVNQLLPHLKTASDKAQELENSNYPAANTIKNFWASATGDPRVKKFETVREVAAMDAARLLRGSGAMAEQDIEFWRKNLAAAGSPAQLQETLGLLADDLMGARISSIQHSYRTNMRMEPPDFVSKEAKEALAAIRTRGAKPGGEQPAAAASPAGASAPMQSDKPDAATRFQQLTTGGMSKADAYAKMHQEGY